MNALQRSYKIYNYTPAVSLQFGLHDGDDYINRPIPKAAHFEVILLLNSKNESMR